MLKKLRMDLMGRKLELIRWGPRGKTSKISSEWKSRAYWSNVRVVSIGGEGGTSFIEGSFIE